MTPDAYALVQREARAHVGDGFVVGARDRTPGHQVLGLAGVSGLEADQHDAYITARVTDLHRQIGDVARRGDTRDDREVAVDVVAHARRLRVGSQRVALHDPQIGTTDREERAPVVDEATIDPRHRQRETDQEAKPEARQDELAPAVEDVARRQIDHVPLPTSAATIFTFAPGRKVRSL